eukprot:m.8265 g.8265  ORF g.8265 m.8265 type:complete len:393 (+) comp9127_c0_seq1:146-1324(+)
MFCFVQHCPQGLLLIATLGLGAMVPISQAYPTLQRTPAFSFDTLGHATFAHVTSGKPFNTTQLDFLKRFPIVQFDKSEDASLSGVCAEDRFIMAAHQVKAVNPDVFCLFYLNSLIGFTAFEHITNITEEDPNKYYAVDTKGDFVVTLSPYKTFDHTIEATRNLFVQDCLYGLNSGVFDGCFIDRANFAEEVLIKYNGSRPHAHWDQSTTRLLINGSQLVLGALMDAVGEQHIILAKETSYVVPEDWKLVNALMPTDTFCSNYKQSGKSRSYDPTQCRLDIEAVRNASRRGQLTESHAMGFLNDTVQREYTMACFLVAHGNMSYFSYASSLQPWSLPGLRWWPEYDYPLGPPLGEAVVSADGWTYQRNFTSGTTVVVDVYSHSAKIDWAKVSL